MKYCKPSLLADQNIEEKIPHWKSIIKNTYKLETGFKKFVACTKVKLDQKCDGIGTSDWWRSVGFDCQVPKEKILSHFRSTKTPILMLERCVN